MVFTIYSVAGIVSPKIMIKPVRKVSLIPSDQLKLKHPDSICNIARVINFPPLPLVFLTVWFKVYGQIT